MYYRSAEIDEDLACSYCKEKFTGEVKLIPDCGESICSDCYDELKENLDAGGEFKCRACQQGHTMPKSGLPSCRGLSRMLKRRRVERPLSQPAKDLKVRVDSVRRQLAALRSFEASDHVNQLCDRLEFEVIEAIQSAVAELNAQEADLLKQIRDYREKRLADLSQTESATADETAMKKIQQDLDALAGEAQKYVAKWDDFFGQEDLFVGDSEVQCGVGEAAEFEKRMSSYESKLKTAALRGQIMSFSSDLSLFQNKHYWNNTFTLSVKEKQLIEFTIESKQRRSFDGHRSSVRQVLFLPGRRLASCSHDSTVKVWNVDDGQELFELRGHEGKVLALAALAADGRLASGSTDACIIVWDLVERRALRKLTGHTRTVVSLQAMKNGSLLASYSTDDTIRIWSPNATSSSSPLLRTIEVVGNAGRMAPIGVLSSDDLVACARDKSSEEFFLRVWSPEDGRLVKAVAFGSVDAKSVLVLANDEVALGLDNGAVKIVNLVDEARSRASKSIFTNAVSGLGQLSNGCLVACAESYYANVVILSLSDLTCLQYVKVSGSGSFNSLSISPDENFLAGCNTRIDILPITSK